MNLTFCWAGLIASWLVIGCERQPYQHPVAGLGEAPDAEVQRIQSPQLVLSLRHQLPDGGFAVADFDGGVRPQIEPTRLIEASGNLSVRNYRIRVFDELDRAMASDDIATEGDHLEYQIRFAAPLQAGHRYVLLMDAQTGDSILDAQGRPQPEQRLEFEVAGPREKAPPAAPAPRKRRHKRRGLLVMPDRRGALAEVDLATPAGGPIGQGPIAAY